MNEFDITDLNTGDFMRVVDACMERLKLSAPIMLRPSIEAVESYAQDMGFELSRLKKG